MDINAARLMLIDELAKVTAKYDAALAYTDPGFVQATALECPGLEAFKR